MPLPKICACAAPVGDIHLDGRLVFVRKTDIAFDAKFLEMQSQPVSARIVAERRAGATASFIDPLLLGVVNVVRGPYSSYYGSGALGGVRDRRGVGVVARDVPCSGGVAPSVR